MAVAKHFQIQIPANEVLPGETFRGFWFGWLLVVGVKADYLTRDVGL